MKKLKKTEKADKKLKSVKTAKKVDKDLIRQIKKNRNKKRIWRERAGSALYLAPSLIGVLLFFILPPFVVIFYCVIDNTINPEFVFVGKF